MKNFKKIIPLVKQTFTEWSEDNVTRLAAALAYYTIFSLAPLLIVAITAAGFIWDRSAVESRLISEMQYLLGPDGAQFIQTLLQNATQNLQGGLIASFVGIIAIIFGALGAFRELRDALNIIWEITPKKTTGVWKSIKAALRENVFSFAMVIGVGFFLLVSLVISASLTALNRLISGFFPISNALMVLLTNVVSLAIVTLIFALIFKYVPQTKVAWKDVLLGGFVTAILFMIGKLAIGLYLGNSSVGNVFGAAGSLALLLVWVYYSAQILFLGAEFTQVYANMYGSHIGLESQPDSTLVPENAHS